MTSTKQVKTGGPRLSVLVLLPLLKSLQSVTKVKMATICVMHCATTDGELVEHARRQVATNLCRAATASRQQFCFNSVEPVKFARNAKV